MKFVSSKTSNGLSFENIPYGTLVELKMGFFEDDNDRFFAIKCQNTDIGDFYMDIEDGNLYEDVDAYPIIRIINAKIVEEDN